MIDKFRQQKFLKNRNGKWLLKITEIRVIKRCWYEEFFIENKE